MSALVAALVLTLQPGVLLAAAADSWTTVAPMLTARDNLAAATGADGRIYAIGGTAPLFVGTVEAYTLSTDSWSAGKPIPTALASLAAATGADGRIYAIGGNSANGPLNTVEAYTPFPAPSPGLGAVGQPGIAGFAVYAQTHRLNRAMIAVHPARTYQYVGHWTGGGPYSLHVLLTTGRQLTVAVP